MYIDKYKAIGDSLELLTKGDVHTKYTPQEIISYLLLPINNNRIRLYYQDSKPIGLVTWCWLPPDKATLFLEDKYSLTNEDYLLENPGPDYQLWGIEFITPYGHAHKVMKAIRKEHKEMYGTTKVHFRRFYDRNRLHRRTF